MKKKTLKRLHHSAQGCEQRATLGKPSPAPANPERVVPPSITKFTFSYEHWWEAEFEVDMDKAPAACMGSLEFFGDPITRDDESAEGTVRAFLQFWMSEIIELSIHNNTEGVLRTLARTEGIFPLDGSQGVKLIHCNSWTWQPDDFQIKEEAA